MAASAKSARIRLRPGIRDAIYDHVFSELDCEVGGVLVGRYAHKPPSVEVRAIIPALRASGSRASLTFTHDAWQEIHQRLDLLGGGQIVGWYHSHPGFGIFLSRHDLFIHQNFFSDSRQVAFVVDPHSAREGWFGWQDGKVEPLGAETDSRRAPQRPTRTGPPAEPNEVPSRAHVWVERITYALAGIAVGVAIWAGLIRDDPTAASTRSVPARVSQARSGGVSAAAPDPHRQRQSSPSSATTSTGASDR